MLFASSSSQASARRPAPLQLQSLRAGRVARIPAARRGVARGVVAVVSVWSGAGCSAALPCSTAITIVACLPQFSSPRKSAELPSVLRRILQTFCAAKAALPASQVARAASKSATEFPPTRDLGLADTGADVASLQRQLHVSATGRVACPLLLGRLKYRSVHVHCPRAPGATLAAS